MENNKNEIDLIELFIKIYLYLRKYAWIILIAIIIGVVFSVVKSKFQKPVYTSSMIIETKTENNYMYAMTFKEFQERFEKNPGELIVKIINSANDLRRNGNIQVLADRMGLTTEKIQQISSISANYNYTKGEPISDYVTIIATTNNPDIFKPLNAGIINYINNNNYIKNIYIADSVLLTDIISKVNVKIIELDSLQKQLINEDIKKLDISLLGGKSYIMQSIQLVTLKEKLKIELSNLDQVKIVEDFYIPNPTKRSYKSGLIANISIFIFIGLMIIFFIILNKKAMQYKKKL